MSASLRLQQVNGPGYSIGLFVPDAIEVQNNYNKQKETDPNLPFPHWTKLWPAAHALANFISKQPEIVKDKNVLELAAGLGLPSFVAAQYAKTIICSDYLEASVATMEQSVQHLQLSNVHCHLLDWNDLPDNLNPDVLLLSDINYDPTAFDQLHKVLLRFLQQGTTILLATPQRLMAKSFIEKLLPFSKQQQEMEIDQSMVSLFILQQ